jgi:hypothetical protein
MSAGKMIDNVTQAGCYVVKSYSNPTATARVKTKTEEDFGPT